MLIVTMSILLGMQAAAPPTDSDDITVTGQRLTRETARRFVNEISRPIDGQLPTFRHPVCPSVIGMSADHAKIIVNRVRKVVKHVGIPLGPESCQPNLRVIIVEDSRKFVAELKNQKPAFFAGMERAEVERLLRDKGPALAWNATQVQNEDGYRYASNTPGRSPFDRMAKDRVSSGEQSTGAAANQPRAGDAAPVMRTMSASIIKSSTRQSVIDSYVVVDTAAASGKSLMQLADYATMRAIGGAQPPGKDVVVNTILTLFEEGRETPPSIRASDVAYLKALYSASPSLSSVKQINRISKAVLDTSPQ